jgi:hypothetical protein
MWQRSFQRAIPRCVVACDGDNCRFADQSPSGSVWSLGVPGVCVYLPDSYCPGYAYPLICYLHDDGQSEAALWKWFPRISNQNFLGIGIRAPFPSQLGIPGQFRWLGRRADASLITIRSGIEATARDWNIHPDRVYLFGEGSGALVALQQFVLGQAEIEGSHLDLAGVISCELPAWWPRLLPPVPEFLRGQMLFSHPQHNHWVLTAVSTTVW